MGTDGVEAHQGSNAAGIYLEVRNLTVLEQPPQSFPYGILKNCRLDDSKVLDHDVLLDPGLRV